MKKLSEALFSRKNLGVDITTTITHKRFNEEESLKISFSRKDNLIEFSTTDVVLGRGEVLVKLHRDAINKFTSDLKRKNVEIVFSGKDPRTTIKISTVADNNQLPILYLHQAYYAGSFGFINIKEVDEIIEFLQSLY